VPAWLQPVDHAVLLILVTLAVLLVISGVDDMTVDVLWLWAWVRRKVRARRDARKERRRSSTSILDLRPDPSTEPIRTKHIAIMVPLWHEHEVIGRMLEHNLASIRYPEYHIFAGAYPNDAATQSAVHSVCDRFPTVHLALCPHDGPTSKADCLNWIYQNIELYEERTGEHFDIIITHDAEDLIHPEELWLINDYAQRYDYIQTPVLALKTPVAALTHGVYCDEFAENHLRDMQVRSEFGCFIPSAGVGTAYRREALEKLAETESNRVFQPDALTEDYENGLRLFRMGCSQVFIPPMLAEEYRRKRSQQGATSAATVYPATVYPASDPDNPERPAAEHRRDFIATREFFPQSWYTALRQRTRWVTGITLQGWERYGWSGTWSEKYWLWRDRKGLLANPLGVLANFVFFYGLATALWTRIPPLAAKIAVITALMQVLRIGVRMSAVAYIYGWFFSLGVPFRMIYSNALNAAATAQAILRYSWARIHHRPLRWLKTEHSYPTRAALLSHKRRLGEILVGSGYVSPEALDQAISLKPSGMLIGQFLVRNGYLDEDSLYDALSLQQGLPLVRVDPKDVSARVARALPGKVAREWRVLPFRVQEGRLFVAGPDLPRPGMIEALRSFTALEIRFHLVTPSAFERLTAALL
jgi:adsorption protein B